MKTLIKKFIISNKTIKIFSLAIGYGVWAFLGNLYTTAQWVQVPVSFYNVSDITLQATPETVWIKIAGKRTDIQACTDLALHIDAASLPCGTHYIMPTQEELLLPQSIQLVHCKPHAVSIAITKKDYTPLTQG